MNLVGAAQRYVYITTPYLVLDNEMQTALCNAAKRGIDVRIITPHIPDKWYVHAVTKSNYQILIESGVKYTNIFRDLYMVKHLSSMINLQP